MTVFRWNSLQDLFAIQEKVNRLFEETIHRSEFPDDGLEAALWSPAADVFDLTLVLADVSEKALAQVKRGAIELLRPRMDEAAAEGLQLRRYYDAVAAGKPDWQRED